MKYRDKNGILHDFDVIQGMSAYQSAVIGGYDKTEEEFYRELSDLATNKKVEEVKEEIEGEVGLLAEEIAELKENGVGDGEVVINKNSAIFNSIDIEYGRINNETSYYFIRVPQYDIEGNKITPKVAITSDDGSVEGTKKSALEFAEKNETPIVVNASLFNTQTKKPEGQLVIDGTDKTTYKKDSSGNNYAWMDNDMGTAISDTECYPLLIDGNGRLSCLVQNRKADENQPQAIIDAGYKYAVTAWGMVIDEYKDNSSAMNEIVHSGKYIRQVIGQFQNGDYFIMSVDKTGYNGINAPKKNEAGVNYSDLANFLIGKGARIAYSLDGGGSCETVVGKRQVNPIFDGTKGRAVPSVIYFSADVLESDSDEKIMTSIVATKTKKEYEVGETISVSDIIVIAKYSDGTSKVVTNYNTNVSSINTTTSGNKSLVVTYTENGISETYTITISIKENQTLEPDTENTLISGEFTKGYTVSKDAINEILCEYYDARITYSANDDGLEIGGDKTIILPKIPNNIVGVKITTDSAGFAGLQIFTSKWKKDVDEGWKDLTRENNKFVYTWQIDSSHIGKYIAINYKNTNNSSVNTIDCSSWTLEWIY